MVNCGPLTWTSTRIGGLASECRYIEATCHNCGKKGQEAMRKVSPTDARRLPTVLMLIIVGEDTTDPDLEVHSLGKLT